jgi:hypothetical protein
MKGLSKQDELLEIYKQIRGGNYVNLCRLAKEGKDIEGRIVDVPRKIASISDIMQRKMVNEITNLAGFMTTDYFIFNPNGESLIVLDGPYFTKEKQSALGKMLFDEKSNEWFDCIDGRVLISKKQFEEFRTDKQNTLYLTREETENANYNGFIYDGKKWNPENKSIEKVLDFVSRGMNINEYLLKCFPPEIDENKVYTTPHIKIKDGFKALPAYFHTKNNQFNAPVLSPWKIKGRGSVNSINCRDCDFEGGAFFLGIANPEIIKEAINYFHFRDHVKRANENQYKN